MNRDISIVEHMILHAERIVSKTSNKTLDDFSNNPDDKALFVLTLYKWVN